MSNIKRKETRVINLYTSVLALDSVGLRDGTAGRTFCVFSSAGDGRDSADIWPSSTSGNWPVVSAFQERYPKVKKLQSTHSYLRRLWHCAVTALSLCQSTTLRWTRHDAFDVDKCLCILLGTYCKARSETLCFSSMSLELGYI